jgi:hypothetical protein
LATKAGAVLDLDDEVLQGGELGPDVGVVSADEKTSIQAPCRCHPTLPPDRARVMRVEHEDERGGALAYPAAWDVHQARLFGRCQPTTGIAPFGRLVEQVMTTEPHASARRVFWILDNGSSHRGRASVERLQGAWPNLRLVHLASARLVAEPGRALLLDRATQGLDPNDVTDLAESSTACSASSVATSRPPPRSTGASPEPTSPSRSAGWTSTTTAPPRHDHHARTSTGDH